MSAPRPAHPKAKDLGIYHHSCAYVGDAAGKYYKRCTCRQRERIAAAEAIDARTEALEAALRDTFEALNKVSETGGYIQPGLSVAMKHRDILAEVCS